MSRGYFCVGLSHPKSAVNVGAALRATKVYRGSLFATSGRRFKKVCTDTMKAHRHMPVLSAKDDLKTLIPYDCIPVAVEIVEGARALPNYVHPERAFYIFGPEDGTLGKKVLSYCRDVVYIPTDRCMNLAATVNVVLYDRLAKEMRR